MIPVVRLHNYWRSRAAYRVRIALALKKICGRHAGWRTGFGALEHLIGRHGRGYAFGDRPTLADCYLLPQAFSAGRFEVDLGTFPRIAEAVRALPALAAAAPENQLDVPQ
jgi:glutathione S-transferase